MYFMCILFNKFFIIKVTRNDQLRIKCSSTLNFSHRSNKFSKKNQDQARKAKKQQLSSIKIN